MIGSTSPPSLGPGSCDLLDLITFFINIFLFNYMIKIDIHKIEYQSKNKTLI